MRDHQAKQVQSAELRLRREAMQLVLMLPESRTDARKVIALMNELLDGYLAEPQTNGSPLFKVVPPKHQS